MMRGWSRLYAIANDWIQTGDDIIYDVTRRKEMDVKTLTRKLKPLAQKVTEQLKNEQAIPKSLIEKLMKATGLEEDELVDEIVDATVKKEPILYRLQEVSRTTMHYPANPTIDVNIMVRQLHSVIMKHIFKLGFFILTVSYLEQDVAPAYATIIQSIPPMGAGRVTPTSQLGRNLERPKEQYYPSRLDTEENRE